MRLRNAVWEILIAIKYRKPSLENDTGIRFPSLAINHHHSLIMLPLKDPRNPDCSYVELRFLSTRLSNEPSMDYDISFNYIIAITLENLSH